MSQQASPVKIEKGFWKRILFFFRPFWRYFGFITFILVLVQIISALTPYLFGKAVDAVTNLDARKAFLFFGISALAHILQSEVFSFFRERVELKHLDHHIEKSFATRSMSKMFSFSIGQHINEHSGVKQSIVNRGQNSLTNFMYMVQYNMLPNIIQILVILVILAFFDWRVAFVSMFFTVCYVLISLKRNRDFFPKVEKIRKNNQDQTKLSSELFRNSTLVISEGKEDETLQSYKDSYDDISAFTTNTWLRYLKIFYSHKVFLFLGRYLSLGLGLYLIIKGYHSTGMFVTFFSWIQNIFGNITSIMNQQRHLLFQTVEIKKFFDLLDIKPDIDLNESGKIIPNLKGEIEFKNVSFAYPYRKSKQEEENEINREDKTEEHALTDINFKITAGSKIGFVGLSGSGKTTIVNLMRRFYDVKNGEILIDGESIKDLNLRWLRSQIGNVEQKIDLFDRTIRENILFGLQDELSVGEKKLNKVIKDSSLSDFISKLENGLDTMIGEGGIKVSGGERQRIGIARALIKNPKILIFDEATSALDSINEKLIHQAINRSAKGRTTIMIAHRLSTVMDADVIFVVSEGKIVDSGTHEELKKRCKEYKELIKNQIF